MYIIICVCARCYGTVPVRKSTKQREYFTPSSIAAVLLSFIALSYHTACPADFRRSDVLCTGSPPVAYAWLMNRSQLPEALSAGSAGSTARTSSALSRIFCTIPCA
eukprot:COSAG01_NODE_1041_length_11959_cov_2.673356_2_plen_106_part_00